MIVVPGAIGDITAVVAGDGLSGGATEGSATVDLDLNELTAAVVAVASDSIAIIDADDDGSKKESVADFVSGIAGTNMSASSGQLSVADSAAGTKGIAIVAGTSPVSVSYSSGTATVSVTDSSTSAKGIASFSSDNFAASSGAITIKDNGVAIAEIADIARGSIIIGNASAETAELTIGNNTYVLTSDGTDIAWAAASSGVSLSGSTDNTVATVTGANALAGEANLTFDGSTLAVTGAVTVSTDLTVSGGDIVYGNGQNATASVAATAHDAAGKNLTITAGPTTAATTDNIAGGTLTLQGGQGKGSGAGGDIIFQTANAAGSGSSLNSHATALTISDDLSATFAGGVDITNSAGITLENDETITNSTNGTISFSGGIAVPDAGNIGSASDLDAIAISSGGVVTFSQDVTMTADMSLNLPQGANVKFTDAITQDSIDDHDAQGIIMTFQAGMTVTPFSPVYLGTDDEVHECNADAIATMPCIGVSVNTSNVADGNSIEVMLLGLIRDESFTDFGTNGAPVYVHTTVGEMSNTAPSGDDEVVQIIGHSVGEKLLFVQPSLTYLVVDA